MSDLDIHLAAIKASDADAFGIWMSAAEPEIRSTLRSFATSVDTEAVLQEALLRVWQVAPYPEDTKAGLGKRLAWLETNILKGISFEYKIVAA